MMLSIHLGSRAAFGLEEHISSHHRTLIPLGGKLHTSGIGMSGGVALPTTFTLDAIHDP